MKITFRYLASVLICLFLTQMLFMVNTSLTPEVYSDTLTQNIVSLQSSNDMETGYALTSAVGSNISDGEEWTYDWLPDGFTATCDETGDFAMVMLERGTYTYCPEHIPTTFSWIVDTMWSDMEVLGIAPYTTAYRLDGSKGEFVYGFPSAAGTYQVSMALPSGVDTTTPYWSMLGRAGSGSVTIKITHTATGAWKSEGDEIVTYCTEGEALAKVYLSGDVTEYLCEENPDSYITTWYRDDNAKSVVTPTMPSFVTLYEGTGDTEYDLTTVKPDTPGTYEMYIAVLSDSSDPDSATIKSNSKTLTILDHEWCYTTDEYSLCASCDRCGTDASVTIDTSTVYEASRNYNGESLDYEVFYEENWSSQAGIESYYVLFSGYQTFETTTTVYDRAFVKPDSTGNYNVRLALLEDPDDPETAWLSTKEKPYYLADIGIGECQIITYGNEQIYQFTEPKFKNMMYQVGTLSEFLWCVYNANSDSFISLTNDIVVNPITVNEKGEIRCGSYQIYTWDGFGSESNYFEGMILGNGYTIYGLYQPSASAKYSGLIDYCADTIIQDLTVENSVFYGVNVGAIAGRYDCTYDARQIDGCNALNCYLSGSSTAGAMIGLLSGKSGSDLTIENCSNNSIVSGENQYGAGGIIGKAEKIGSLSIQQCCNLGNIFSTKGYAGGIIGWYQTGSTNCKIEVLDCFNTGSVKCPNYCGGIAGYIKNDKTIEGVSFDNCTSTGYLYSSSNLGGITGSIELSGQGTLLYAQSGNYYYNASVGFNKTIDATSPQATKLTRAQFNGGFVCSKYGHTESSHWTAVSSPSCTSDGKLKLTCAVCDATMESEVIAAHGHRYEYGQCIFCGAYEDDDDLEGAIFGDSSVLVTVAAALVLLVLAVVCYCRKRKKG